MRIAGWVGLGIFLYCAGCQSQFNSKDAFSAGRNDFAAGKPAAGATAATVSAAVGGAPASTQMRAFRELVRSASQPSGAGSSWASRASAQGVAAPEPGGAVRALLAEPLVQKSVEAAYEQQTQGRVVQPREITTDDLSAFVRRLTERKEALIQELAAGDAASADAAKSGGGPDFAKVLVAYYKAYGSGDFIDRDGTNLSKPDVSSGVSDDDIQGIATVFFEAMYDCVYADMPVFCKLGQKVESRDSKGQITNPKIGDEEPATRTYIRVYYAEYLTEKGAEPTAVSAGFAAPARVDTAGTGVTSNEAKAIRRIGKIAGRQAKSLTGTLFGLLSNINVSFVVGADFAVGDNDTLLHLVETFTEVSARRSAEYMAYGALSRAGRGTAGVARVAAAPSSTNDQQVLDLVRSLED